MASPFARRVLKVARRVSDVALLAACLAVCEGRAHGQPTAVIGRSYPGSPAFLYDAEGAVGPAHYAEITNLGFRVTALATGTVVYSAASLSQFWTAKVGLPFLTGCCFDPSLVFDHASGRWFALSLSGPRNASSSLYLGVSASSDPSGTWRGVIVDADPANLRWADFTYLGVDGAGVYVATGLPGIASTTPFQWGEWVFPKGDLLAVPPTAARVSRFASDFPTTDPAAIYYAIKPPVDYLGTSSEGLHLDAVGQPSLHTATVPFRWAVDAAYQRMTGQSSGAVALQPWARTPALVFDSPVNPATITSVADFGRQPGTAMRLNNGSGSGTVRIGDAMYEATSTPVRGRMGIVWRRFQPSTNTVVDAGFIVGDGQDDLVGASISANARGDVVIAFTRVGPTRYASLFCIVGRPDATGRLVFGQQMLLKEGTNLYDENGPIRSPGVARFIDYAASVTVHPSDPTRFWISGPYVATRNVASTWIAEVVLLETPPVRTTTSNELLWRNTNGSTVSWVMNGLSIASSGLLMGAALGWDAVQTGSFDGAASRDILWQHGDGRSALWLMNGTALTGGTGLLGPATGWLANRLGDFDGDGRRDIVWQHTDGSTALWLMNGLSLHTAGSLVGPNTGWVVQHVLDIDGNGRDDLIWLDPRGTTVLWQMNGVNAVATSVLLPAGTGWAVQSTGDFNGDGTDDLLWRHQDGTVSLWMMNGPGLIGAATLRAAGSGWTLRSSGRVDAGPTRDLLWEHADGRAELWLMDGAGTGTPVPLLPAGTGWRLHGLVDLNSDGRNDFLWRHPNGTIAGWLMDGSSLLQAGLLVGAGTGWSPLP